MKKWICFLGGFLCYMLCAFPVRADVIWEPRDSFYEENASECEYVGRVFTANGPDGVVILYASPVSDWKIATWENGTRAYIYFTYEDKNGMVWGIYEDTASSKTGWMPMEYMDVVYDSISFAEEYGADFQIQDGTPDDQYVGKSVYFWKYPAAPDPYPVTLDSYLPEYHRIYEDSEGHTWGNVGYYYGHKNVWICLDQPDAEMDELYPDKTPGIGESQPVEKDFTQDRITPEGAYGSLTAIVAGAVAMVVAATGILLLALKRKGQKKY